MGYRLVCRFPLAVWLLWASTHAAGTIGSAAMTKITAEHLARSAIVYIRQSTSYQVANNLESQRDVNMHLSSVVVCSVGMTFK